MESLKIIQGGSAIDQRGKIRYVNDFDMSLVKRFYIIKNSDTDLIRGWRAHRIEQRWFYVLAGSFDIDFIEIDDWETPDRNLPILSKKLDFRNMQVLNVPPGYGTAFRALEPESELLVFADYAISHASLDDYTWPVDYFKNFECSK